MRREQTSGFLSRLPLFLQIWAVSSVAMWMPAAHALAQDNHRVARAFFYSGLMGLIAITLVALSRASRPSRHSPLGQLLSLLATFLLLPVFLAVPMQQAQPSVGLLDAYFEMVSAVTTTGATLFDTPADLLPSVHLWRAEVGWLGGFLMWVAASAILAPLSLGGFEVTTQGAPGRAVAGPIRDLRADSGHRLVRLSLTLAPIYIGLTGTVWILLLIAGEEALTGFCHAMSVMATSGISPVGGMAGSNAGLAGEMILFLFMFFALSRLTFSSDTAARGYARLDRDPEFRIGLLLVLLLPLLLFVRHWIGALEENDAENTVSALRAFWGAMFTVLSFLSTTGFESADWDTSRYWSGLETSGLILLGLALIGGGVATTAGGVKLLRVYALYLNGLREMERLVYPSSVSPGGTVKSRIQKDGAFIAFVFFMLFALSLAFVAMVLAALGSSFEQSMVLAIATLSTTGPLIQYAAESPMDLAAMGAASKAVLCAAMVLGRLEMLAIIALFTPDLWRA